MANEKIKKIAASTLIVGTSLITGCKNLPIIAKLKNQPVRVVHNFKIEYGSMNMIGDLLEFKYLDSPGVIKSFISGSSKIEYQAGNFCVGKDYIIDANIYEGDKTVFIYATKIQPLIKSKADSILISGTKIIKQLILQQK